MVAPLNPKMYVQHARSGPGYQQPIGAALRVSERLVPTAAEVTIRLPDIVCWHELGGSGNITGNIASYGSLENSLGIPPREISINEYSGAIREQEVSPEYGSLVTDDFTFSALASGSIKLYPNTASEQFTIDLPFYPDNAVDLNMYTAEGVLVAFRRLTAQSNTIDV